MKAISNDELTDLATKTVEGGKVATAIFSVGYRLAEAKHLKTITKLQKILKSHRVVIETMYAPKKKK